MGSLPRGISASRGAAILGLSQWATPVTVWAQIMEERQPGFCEAHGITPPDPVDNAAVRWGTAFEVAVIELAEIVRDQRIGAREAFCQVNPGAPITCHLDGIYEDGTIHEGKTTSIHTYREKWGEPGTDRIPREYAVQVQHQMIASGAYKSIVSVLVFPLRVEEFEAAGSFVRAEDAEGGRGIVIDPSRWAAVFSEMGLFHQYEIAANPQLHELIIAAYSDFWRSYVLTCEPPPAQNWDDVKRLLPEPRGTVIATSDQERLANEYAQIGSEVAQAEKRQDQIKTEMIGVITRGAEHPIDDDSVEAIVLRDGTGRKIASYAKDKRGRRVFRCGG